METLLKPQMKDIRIIGRFVQVYCHGRHGTAERSAFELPAKLGSVDLCAECAGLAEYAIARRLNCPLEAEKPACKHCRIHCYATAQRKLMQEIMAYSGRKLVLKGRLDYLWHYFF